MTSSLRYIIVFVLGLTALTAQEKVTWKELETGMRFPGFFVQDWLDDSHYIFRQDNRLMRCHALSGETKPLLDPAQMEAVRSLGIAPEMYESASDDLTQFVYLHSGDVYHFDSRSKKATRLTDTAGEEQNPSLTSDGRYLAYTRNGNLYLQRMDCPGSEIALTDDGSEQILNGYASWVYYEEILGRRSNYSAFWFSSDGNKLAFLRFDQSAVGVYPVLWFNELYGKLEKQRYPKPGTANPEVSLFLVDTVSLKKVQIAVPETKGNYLTFPRFSQYRKDLLYVQWLNRDQNHFRLYACDMGSGTVRVAYEETQPAWIDFFEESDLFFLPADQILLRSSRDGWYHLYRIDKGGKTVQLTRGPWSVDSINTADPRSGKIFFSAFKEDSTRCDLYRMNLAGGKIERMTDGIMHHQCNVSPKGSFFVDTRSSLIRPQLTELVNVATKKKKVLADATSERYKSLKVSQPKLIRVKTADGLELPVIYTLPADYQPGRRYPVVVEVYGGPGARAVTASFPRSFLNDQYLTQQGIIVVSADHRGAGHHGKAGMNAMHRRLGYWEINDYSAVVDYFVNSGLADPERIGITGGSYGGYITALALVKAGDRFKYGIAQYSVCDWQLYDSVYTERFMDTPQQNPDGYREASVLTYVDQYREGLLLTHGTVDDNVHMQNTMQLADRLQDAHKPFQMMIYPRSRHGIRGPKREFDRRLSMDFWMRSFFDKPFIMEK